MNSEEKNSYFINAFDNSFYNIILNQNFPLPIKPNQMGKWTYKRELFLRNVS